jgi:2-aminobenzoate-CoA ligase
MHFHRDLLAVSDCFGGKIVNASADDLFCGTPPLAFTYALGGLLLFPMRIGASSVLLEQSSPENLLIAIQTYRPTICFTSPTGYRAMLGMLDRFDLGSLRMCVSAGEPLPLATFEAWERATGLHIIDGIGSTELLHIFISAANNDIRPGSLGKAVPGYRACVVDENGSELPPGISGWLAVRGPTGCRYLADEVRQKQYVRFGWNITGDVCRVDADGYFWYEGRKDDMIVSGGYKIAPLEIENVLLEHPKVAECGVIGVPDDIRGEIVTAFVVVKQDVAADGEFAKELQNFAKANIAPYKYPRSIKFLQRLPRTATGKLQRHLLHREA